MKILLSISITMLFVSFGIAQDHKKDKWHDKAYHQRNLPLFNAIIEMHERRWNKAAGYLVRSPGDTIRPYTRAEWMRDSLALAHRNWDAVNEPWPSSFSKKEVYDPNKNYKYDSALSNKAGRTQDVKLADAPGKSHSLIKDDRQHHTGEDFLFMNNEQLMVSKSGVRTRVLGFITLPDGTRVIEDGRILLKNGQNMQLHEGEIINLYDPALKVIQVVKD